MEIKEFYALVVFVFFISRKSLTNVVFMLRHFYPSQLSLSTCLYKIWYQSIANGVENTRQQPFPRLNRESRRAKKKGDDLPRFSAWKGMKDIRRGRSCRGEKVHNMVQNSCYAYRLAAKTIRNSDTLRRIGANKSMRTKNFKKIAKKKSKILENVIIFFFFHE